MELDEEPRVVDVPEDFGRALAAESQAQAAFDQLSYTHRKEYVDWITSATRGETEVDELLKRYQCSKTAERTIVVEIKSRNPWKWWHVRPIEPATAGGGYDLSSSTLLQPPKPSRV